MREVQEEGTVWLARLRPQASREGAESCSSCLVETHGILRRLVIAALSVPTTRVFVVRNVWLYLKRIIGRSKIQAEGWF